MKQTAKQITNFFIVTSSIRESVDVTERNLSFLARQAYVNREFENLGKLSIALLNLPSHSGEIGRFYQALDFSRQGKGNNLFAQKVFEELADAHSPKIRAASTLAIGRLEMRAGNYADASRTLLEASKLALSNDLCGPLTFINAQNALSVMQGLNGAYDESIRILKGIEPFTKIAARYFPPVLGELWNNLACGYGDLGDYQTASYYINKATSISIIKNYPEWIETKQDIAQMSLRKPSPSRVFLPFEEFVPSDDFFEPEEESPVLKVAHISSEEIETKKADVLPFRCARLHLNVALFVDEFQFDILNLRLGDNSLTDNLLIELLASIGILIVEEETDYFLKCFIFPGDPQFSSLNGYIEFDSINSLMETVEPYRNLKADLAAPNEVVTEQSESEVNIQNIMRWLMPMLEENSK